jgi:hypothetical protein
MQDTIPNPVTTTRRIIDLVNVQLNNEPKASSIS